MSLFEKRVLLFRKRDKETWGSLKRVLKRLLKEWRQRLQFLL